jgi:hypothetical protein
MTNFSDFAIARSIIFPLPIEIASFTGKRINNNNELEWSTKSETNNNYFVIEKSFDGVNFETVNKINGAGNSNYTLNYTYTDYNTSEKLIYYRLKQVDFDGMYSYSKIISIKSNTISNSTNFVYVQNDYIIIENSNDENYSVKLFDITGKLLYSKEYINNYDKINISMLPKGIYMLNIYSKNNLTTKKIIK